MIEREIGGMYELMSEFNMHAATSTFKIYDACKVRLSYMYVLINLNCFRSCVQLWGDAGSPSLCLSQPTETHRSPVYHGEISSAERRNRLLTLKWGPSSPDASVAQTIG